MNAIIQNPRILPAPQPVVEALGCEIGATNDIPMEMPHLDLPTRDERLAKSLALNNALIYQFEQSVARVVELERRFKIVHLMMQNMVDADMPETVSRDSFKMFAKCRLAQFHKIAGDAIGEEETTTSLAAD